MVTLRIRPDKIASVCLPFEFGPYLSVSSEILSQEGAAIVCRVLEARGEYGELELLSGRMAKLMPGDVIAGVLGNRAALRGFSGRVPESLKAGEEIHLLNRGGVCGRSQGEMVGLGTPIRLEVIGTPIHRSKPALLGEYGLPESDKHSGKRPALIAVAGTCMNSGKSTAACSLIRRLKNEGHSINAGKATGVAAVRDPLAFRDYGASLALSFLDCGVPSTAYHSDTPELTLRLLDLLEADEPDVILLELGDGLLGVYGVDEILESAEFQERLTGVILAANDVFGGHAAAVKLRGMGLNLLSVVGPATDNLAGVEKLESLGVPAANILREPDKLWNQVHPILENSR